MPSGSSSGGPDEWSAIRSLIASYDSNLHDLRKTGLAVITALLTATAVSTLFNLPNYEVFTLILLTYLLILIMQYLDQHYRTIQSAAMARARVLEPLLNVELSQKIATVYHERHAYLVNPALYIALIAIACTLGCAIIYSTAPATPAANSTAASDTSQFTNASVIVLTGEAPSHLTVVSVNLTPGAPAAATPPASLSSYLASLWKVYILLLGALAVASGIAMIWISNTVQINVRRNGNGPPDDWVVDKISCVKGDVVKITVTNLGKSEDQQPADSSGLSFTDVVCDIRDETGKIVDTIRVENNVVIPYRENHSWLWDTTPAHIRAKALYTIWPKDWTVYALAQIAVLDQPSDGKKPQPEKVRDFECWSVDKASCEMGGAVTITVTNVSCPCEGKTLVFKKGDMVCRIHPDGRDHGAQITAETRIEIPPDGRYSWLWDTTPADVKENTLYRITPGTFTIMPDDQRQPPAEKSLHQTVTVLKKEAGSGT